MFYVSQIGEAEEQQEEEKAEGIYIYLHIFYSYLHIYIYLQGLLTWCPQMTPRIGRPSRPLSRPFQTNNIAAANLQWTNQLTAPAPAIGARPRAQKTYQ